MDLDNHFPCSIFLLLNQNNSQKIFSCFSWCYIIKFYASFLKDIVSLQETISEWILTLCMMSAEWMYCKGRWQNLCNSPSSHLLISSPENTALPQPTQFRCSSLSAEGTSYVSVGSTRWVFQFSSPEEHPGVLPSQWNNTSKQNRRNGKFIATADQRASQFSIFQTLSIGTHKNDR